jgi:hypothetical protein
MRAKAGAHGEPSADAPGNADGVRPDGAGKPAVRSRRWIEQVGHAGEGDGQSPEVETRDIWEGEEHERGTSATPLQVMLLIKLARDGGCEGATQAEHVVRGVSLKLTNSIARL